MQTPTPHNGAVKGQIAPVVLMPGDPLRAERIAGQFLTGVSCYNTVRGMLGFTGSYQGKPVSVQGSGMGCPSMGIYSYELFAFYGVETIIRVGTAGGLAPDLSIGDLVAAVGCSTDSNYPAGFGLPGSYAPTGDFELLSKARSAAAGRGYPFRAGNILTSDFFYNDDPDRLGKWQKMGVLAVEMENAALYCNAARAGKKALGLFTVSDCPLRGLSASAHERETMYEQMVLTALEAGL